MGKVITIITIFSAIVIFGIAGFAIYADISYGTKEGEIIDKKYQKAYTTTTYETVRTGETSTSIPIQKYYPESYQLKIQKEVDEELKQLWIEVTAQEYNELKIGDWYGK